MPPSASFEPPFRSLSRRSEPMRCAHEARPRGNKQRSLREGQSDTTIPFFRGGTIFFGFEKMVQDFYAKNTALHMGWLGAQRLKMRHLLHVSDFKNRRHFCL